MSENMIYLPEAWRVLGTPRFGEMLKDELESLSVEQLPLQQCMTRSSYVLEQKPDVVILATEDRNAEIYIRVGICFSGVIAGCSCADDPTPVEPIPEYCELLLCMNRQTGYITVDRIAS